MGGNCAQAGVGVEEKRGQGEESGGKGTEARFEDTLSITITCNVRYYTSNNSLGEHYYLFYYFEVSVGWNTKAVHLFATASKLVIGGINFILVKGQKIISLECK